MGKFFKFVWLGARLSAAGGAVYLLNEQKVWSPSTDTQAIVGSLRSSVPHECEEFAEKYVTPYLPSSRYLHVDLRRHWNTGVLFTCSLLARLPETCGAGATWASAALAEAWAAVGETKKDMEAEEKCDCPEEKK